MSKAATIHGETAVSLAAILEYIQKPGHPFHDQAKTQADAFVEAQRQTQLEQGRRMMREQMKHIDADEWAAIVD